MKLNQIYQVTNHKKKEPIVNDKNASIKALLRSSFS